MGNARNDVRSSDMFEPIGRILVQLSVESKYFDLAEK